MAWNGSGTFTRTNGVNTGSGVWTSDRDASVKITASRHDTHDQDLAAGINACLAKNGENAMTGDLNMGGNDVTNAAAGTFSGAVTASTVSDATGNVRSGRRNLLINGGFDVWQRSTSQTSSGYGSADRWRCGNTGTTKTASRQTFTLGQTDVPGNPKYWMRHVVTSSAGAANYCGMWNNIEGVQNGAGQSVTFSFYGKADASRQVAIEFYQSFGTGGSPSSDVSGIGAQKFTLTTSWQRFSATVSIPSISGKTLGSDGNDFLQWMVWFDAGSNYDARTDTLGQQSGTFDIANVQVEIGSAATTFEALPIGETLALCQRYYITGSAGYQAYMPAGTNFQAFRVSYPVYMRATPALVLNNSGTNTSVNGVGYNTNAGFSVSDQVAATGIIYRSFSYTADAEL